MMESLERLKSIGEDACGSFDAVDDDLHTPKVAKRIFGFFSVPCRSQPSTLATSCSSEKEVSVSGFNEDPMG